ILMKCGIKSEIHDCTIELMSFFDFDDSDIVYLRKLKFERIQVQYYLKNLVLDDELSVKEFIFKCKQILADLDSLKIETIRLNVDVVGC
ncbi:MAG: hypothetical protein KAS12_01915, partial [Candidatus Aenigmarchaeota archaeon]|nr:hypothetical protein [Candidatus Aenigmarchaeota archaeon]